MTMGMMPGPGGVVASTPPAVPAVWDAAKTPSQNTRTSDTVMTCNTTDGAYTTSACNIGNATGKWLFTMEANTNDAFMGIAAQQPSSDAPWVNSYHLGFFNAGFGRGECVGIETYNGEIWYNSQAATTAGTTSASGQIASNTVITVAVDLDSSPQTVKFFNGDTLLNSFTLPSGMTGFTWYPACSLLISGNTMTLNAGQSTIAVPTPISGQGYNPYWE